MVGLVALPANIRLGLKCNKPLSTVAYGSRIRTYVLLVIIRLFYQLRCPVVNLLNYILKITKRRHDIHHNGTNQNDTQRQRLICDIPLIRLSSCWVKCFIDCWCCMSLCRVSFIRLSVITLSAVSLHWVSLCRMPLWWVPLWWVSLWWVSLCRVSLCRVSLCWVSLC